MTSKKREVPDRVRLIRSLKKLIPESPDREILVHLVEAKFPTAKQRRRAQSRQARFEEAQGMVGDAKSEFESLHEEIEGWFDNLPESLQGSEKGTALEDCRDAVQECVDACETIEGASPSFPGMY